MTRGILFDKDGTLLDLEKTWIPPYRKAAEFIADLAECSTLADRLMQAGGFDCDTGQWMPNSVLASGSNDEVLSVWQSQLEFKLSADQQNHIREAFFLSSVRHVPVIEDLVRLVHGLESRGIVLGLATMDDESSARAMLRQFNLARSFAFVCGADSGFGIKPEPGMVHAFCRFCDLNLNEVMVVGDSRKDLLMAKNANVGQTVGVLSGAHGREHLAADADAVLESIEELPQLLDSLLLKVQAPDRLGTSFNDSLND